ncbi:hypothetical protein E2562_018483 [Oryza meyeriana var. granulata]|uniref:Uncharacterized protein n=1 Tax=Oryza meyeriana var. granulata TaxID=110450 RepID=A0A6G1EMJ4_9ORYZ|nr:hypothetical protein E2562_018483 [Oryza meyeriana var. granulata]
MGKKKGATVAPSVFPFPAAALADEPWHFRDYGFDDDPRLRCFFPHVAAAKRPAATRHRHHQHQQPAPLESARFKLQKPISKKHHHNKQQQQRRRWWSSAASAALLFFKRGSSSDAAASVPSSYSTAALSPAGPLYIADEDDDGAAACACWAPPMRSGHLAASELGASASVLQYVSLRDSAGDAGGGVGGAPPAMPIYLVT